MPASPENRYRRYRVPRGDGESLVEPPVDEVPQLIAAARSRLLQSSVDIAGRMLGDLVRSARQSLASAALAYTRSYRDIAAEVAERAITAEDVPLLVSGHQAELYHPGVWFKNFVLDEVARRESGLGIHLMIDTDTCRAASIRVPTGTIEIPRATSVPLDATLPAVPYEQRRIADAPTWESFGQRAVETIEPLVADPLVAKLWPDVLRQAGEVDGRIGWAMSRGRHRLEADWGSDTLEIPHSLVCQLPEVRWLVCHMLYELPRLFECHNAALARYRAAHHVRSPAQPMPDLLRDGDWLEAPLWVHTDGDPVRRALYAHTKTGGISLTDRRGWSAELSLNAAAAVEQLAQWERAGIHVRTRALTTTFVARFLLADLFLHGIGGAKYDEVTTDLATSFLGVAPADYVAISATVHLPIEHAATPPSRITAIDRELRDMHYHPERYLTGDTSAGVTTAQKQKAASVAMSKTPANAAERHAAIIAANEVMRQPLESRFDALRAERQQVAQRVRASRVLDSREYSLCLYPEVYLREQVNKLSNA